MRAARKPTLPLESVVMPVGRVPVVARMADGDGAVAVILVSLPTTRLVTASPPNVTAVAPVRFVPVMVTLVPAAGGPLSGLRLVTVGTPAYLYSVFAAVVPPGVVTRTLAVPALPAGVVAVIVVALVTVKLVAAVPPIVTPVAVVRLTPVMVTLVPPAIGPLLGLRLVTVGAVI